MIFAFGDLLANMAEATTSKDANNGLPSIRRNAPGYGKGF
jgi:hypothetical protein